MHFSLCGRKLHLQTNSEDLRQVVFIENRIEGQRIKLRQLSEVVNKLRLRNWNCDVEGFLLSYRFDCYWYRRPFLRDSYTYSFGLQLKAQKVEKIPRAEDFQRLRSIRTHLRHQTQSAADHLFGQYLRLCCERPQPQHD